MLKHGFLILIAAIIQATIGWTPGVGGAPVVLYTVYQQDGCLAGTAFNKVGVVGTALVHEYTALGLALNKAYCFQVTASDTTGQESGPSNVLRVICRKKGQSVKCQ